MKRNETVLVYAVTGLLLVILFVAVVFGSQPAKGDAGREKSAQLPGVTPSLMEGLKPAVAPVTEAGKGDSPSPGSAEVSVPETDVAKPEAGSAAGAAGGPLTPATESSTAVALSQPVVLPASLLENAFGTSKRDGDYRLVKAWRGASLAAVVERWTGGAEAMVEVETLNEHLGARIAQGEEVLVPWVEADVLLAAKTARDARHKKVDWAKGELYRLKKGDSLWKVASRRVATKLIPAWLEQFKALNPEISDLSALVEGQKVRLPH